MSDETREILYKVTATPSMLATLYMMYEISTDKKKRKRTYFRLIFGLSFIEFWDSVLFFLGPWASPDGRNGAACQFQGFLLQASRGSMLYNSFLALYYLLSFYNWSERRIAQKAEPWMHAIALSIAYGTAIACLIMGLFEPLGMICYINPRTQGDNAILFSIFFSTVWVWSSVAFTAVCMTIVWWGVRTQENKMARYAFGDSAGVPVRKNSRQCLIQGLLYVFVYYFCHLFAVISYYRRRNGDYNPTLSALVALTFPLEGFLNFLVYMRPRLVKYLKKRRKRLEAAKKSAAKKTAAKESAEEPEIKESAAKGLSATEVAEIESSIIEQLATNTKSEDVMEDQHASVDVNADSKRSALSEELLLDAQELDDLHAY